MMKRFYISTIGFCCAFTILFAACAGNKKSVDEKIEKANPNKVLVAYFSQTGNTERIAQQIAEASKGDLFKIIPDPEYTEADLDYKEHSSRSSLESRDSTSRPGIQPINVDINNYRIVFLGYPIWWDDAPRVIYSFLDQAGLKDQVIIPFATSGSSGIGTSEYLLQQAYPDFKWSRGKLLNDTDIVLLKQWIENKFSEVNKK